MQESVLDLLDGGFTLDEAVLPIDEFDGIPEADLALIELRSSGKVPASGMISAAEFASLLGKDHRLSHMKHAVDLENATGTQLGKTQRGRS